MMSYLACGGTGSPFSAPSEALYSAVRALEVQEVERWRRNTPFSPPPHTPLHPPSLPAAVLLMQDRAEHCNMGHTSHNSRQKHDIRTGQSLGYGYMAGFWIIVYVMTMSGIPVGLYNASNGRNTCVQRWKWLPGSILQVEKENK